MPENIVAPWRAGLNALALAAVVLAGSTACTTDGGEQEGPTSTVTTQGQEGTTETSATTEDSATQTSTESEGTFSESDDSPATSGSFYAPPEADLSPVTECDPFAQDCPDGEKCVAYSGDESGSLNANKCVPVLGSGEPGDACVSTGPIDATDDCDFKSYCFWVNEDAQGFCAAFCSGSSDDPVCAPNSECLQAGPDNDLAICIPSCDPLVQDCPMGQTCTFANDDFNCINHVDEPALSGEPCAFIDDCAPGTLCVDAMFVPECLDDGCCTEYCDTSDMAFMCTGVELECVLFFEEPAPEGFEDLGLCVAPPP